MNGKTMGIISNDKKDPVALNMTQKMIITQVSRYFDPQLL